MTDRQTEPTTEARKRLLHDWYRLTRDEAAPLLDAIEAESRADAEGELALCRRAEDALVKVAEAWKQQAETARADALREAAERVRAYMKTRRDGMLPYTAVLAILDPETTP